MYLFYPCSFSMHEGMFLMPVFLLTSWYFYYSLTSMWLAVFLRLCARFFLFVPWEICISASLVKYSFPFREKRDR
jgi:hypothetical protein